MSVKEKATAPVPSVGADGKQSLCKTNKESIADLPDKEPLPTSSNVPTTARTMFRRKRSA